jgi:site-specific recombinase XerD
MERDFLPFIRTTKASKPNTVRFYENSVLNLKAYAKLAPLHLDEITAEHITGFVAHRQTANSRSRRWTRILRRFGGFSI